MKPIEDIFVCFWCRYTSLVLWNVVSVLQVLKHCVSYCHTEDDLALGLCVVGDWGGEHGFIRVPFVILARGDGLKGTTKGHV